VADMCDKSQSAREVVSPLTSLPSFVSFLPISFPFRVCISFHVRLFSLSYICVLIYLIYFFLSSFLLPFPVLFLSTPSYVISFHSRHSLSLFLSLSFSYLMFCFHISPFFLSLFFPLFVSTL
jgi:hypothetical protein